MAVINGATEINTYMNNESMYQIDGDLVELVIGVAS